MLAHMESCGDGINRIMSAGPIGMQCQHRHWFYVSKVSGKNQCQKQQACTSVLHSVVFLFFHHALLSAYCINACLVYVCTRLFFFTVAAAVHPTNLNNGVSAAKFCTARMLSKSNETNGIKKLPM